MQNNLYNKKTENFNEIQDDTDYTNGSSSGSNKLNVDKHAKREQKNYALVVLQVRQNYNEDNTITIHYGHDTNIGTNNQDGTIDVLTLRII